MQYWGYGTSAATLIVALGAPILGAIGWSHRSSPCPVPSFLVASPKKPGPCIGSALPSGCILICVEGFYMGFHIEDQQGALCPSVGAKCRFIYHYAGAVHANSDGQRQLRVCVRHIAFAGFVLDDGVSGGYRAGRDTGPFPFFSVSSSLRKNPTDFLAFIIFSAQVRYRHGALAGGAVQRDYRPLLRGHFESNASLCCWRAPSFSGPQTVS